MSSLQEYYEYTKCDPLIHTFVELQSDPTYTTIVNTLHQEYSHTTDIIHHTHTMTDTTFHKTNDEQIYGLANLRISGKYHRIQLIIGGQLVSTINSNDSIQTFPMLNGSNCIPLSVYSTRTKPYHTIVYQLFLCDSSEHNDNEHNVDNVSTHTPTPTRVSYDIVKVDMNNVVNMTKNKVLSYKTHHLYSDTKYYNSSTDVQSIPFCFEHLFTRLVIRSTTELNDLSFVINIQSESGFSSKRYSKMLIPIYENDTYTYILECNDTPLITKRNDTNCSIEFLTKHNGTFYFQCVFLGKIMIASGMYGIDFSR